MGVFRKQGFLEFHQVQLSLEKGTHRARRCLDTILISVSLMALVSSNSGAS